jgi:hypothetical protein
MACFVILAKIFIARRTVFPPDRHNKSDRMSILVRGEKFALHQTRDYLPDLLDKENSPWNLPSYPPVRGTVLIHTCLHVAIGDKKFRH